MGKVNRHGGVLILASVCFKLFGRPIEWENQDRLPSPRGEILLCILDVQFSDAWDYRCASPRVLCKKYEPYYAVAGHMDGFSWTCSELELKKMRCWDQSRWSETLRETRRYDRPQVPR
ncbi:hypothetical protein BD779DRAFT_986786 [Infundibulicybe gibba]|nr:hypothetical protein BD779DRAFT_986786 [Infundibulicybe gibba]